MQGCEEMIVRELTPIDIEEVARLHLSSFPESGLTKLGPRVLEKYYAWQFEAPHELVAIGAVEDRVLLGFCLTGRFDGSLSGFLAKYWGPILIAAIRRPNLLADPMIRSRMGFAWRVLRKYGPSWWHARRESRTETIGVTRPLHEL